MPSGKEVVPPPQVAVKDVAPVPQDQQIQSMVDLVRSRIFDCHLQLLSSDIKWKRYFFFLQRNDFKCNVTFQPEEGITAKASPMTTGATGSSEGQRELMRPRWGQKSSGMEHRMFI